MVLCASAACFSRATRHDMPMSLIRDPQAVLSVVSVVVFASLWLESRYRLFRALSASLVTLLTGLLLSNIGIIPTESSVYAFSVNAGVSAGVVLILMSVDLRTIRDAGPAMAGAFALGAIGTAGGAVLASVLLNETIGDETWKLAGQYTGTYTGGGMNFAALAREFDTSGSLFSAAVAADVIVTAIWLTLCLATPAILRSTGSRAPARVAAQELTENSTGPFTLEQALYRTRGALKLSHLAALVAVTTLVLWLARTLSSALPVIPEVLWLTTLALACAQVKVLRRLSGAPMLGYYFVLLFLTCNGAQSAVSNILHAGPGVFYFALITVAVHGVVIFGIGRLVRLDLPTLAIASQANVGGAASAMAMATAGGYSGKLLPGVAVGLLGYAVGNYLGFAVGILLRGWL